MAPQHAAADTRDILTRAAMILATKAHAPRRLVVTATDEQAERMAQELEFFCPAGSIIRRLPSTEVLPYDQESPHGRLLTLRATALYPLLRGDQPEFLVASAPGLLQRIPGLEFWDNNQLCLTVGGAARLDQVGDKLRSMGYKEVPLDVQRYGDFSRSGNTLNIFPIGHDGPARVRLQSGIVQSIHGIDITSQRSISPWESLQAFPTREMPTDANSLRRLRFAYRDRFCTDTHDEFYLSLRDGQLPGGIEAYLSLAIDDVRAPFDLIDPLTEVLLFPDVKEAVRQFEAYAEERFADAATDPSRQPLKPSEIWVGANEAEHAFDIWRSHQLTKSWIEDFGVVDHEVRCLPSADETAQVIARAARKAKKTIVLCETPSRRKQVALLLRLAGLESVETADWFSAIASSANVVVVPAAAESGFTFADGELLVLSERDIFGTQVRATETASNMLTRDFVGLEDLSNIKTGDYLVHQGSGIGVYIGVERLNAGGKETEYLAIGYSNDTKAFVKMTDLAQVAVYNAPTIPARSDIASSDWASTLLRAVADIEQMARDIIRLRNKKTIQQRLDPIRPNYRYTQFLQEFPFRETADQQRSTQEVLRDLAAGIPMDRVLCGDVGFGKTEVAMRAAFLAVEAGKQVAILVPTAILAQQHFESFSERFRRTGIPIHLVEPGKPVPDRYLHLPGVFIGTQSLLKRWHEFVDMGLLVIDEEHRFGVRQKEEISAWRSHRVHVLSMTATPIPRTLHLAFSGVRGFSVLATPPAKRLSIKTIVGPRSQHRAKEAIQRELMRDGQAFWIHNQVSTINETAAALRQLLPRARIAVIHGQMKRAQSVEVMRQFATHEFDVLVATTIVEIGIDVPNANTIIIEDADQFGLAQLHQLRGRVGRSVRQGYAYLFESDSVTNSGAERLAAMAEATELGDGFIIAYRDLEIRGAGEILGDEQSGCIQAIGYGLYSRLLAEGVRAVESGADLITALEDRVIEIDLGVEANLPAEYIPHEPTRLSFYKRLAQCERTDEVSALQDELDDRFGPLPEAAKRQVALAEVMAKMRQKDMRVLIMNDRKGAVRMTSEPKQTLGSVHTTLGDLGCKSTFGSDNQIDFQHHCRTQIERLELAKQLLDLL